MFNVLFAHPGSLVRSHGRGRNKGSAAEIEPRCDQSSFMKPFSTRNEGSMSWNARTGREDGVESTIVHMYVLYYGAAIAWALVALGECTCGGNLATAGTMRVQVCTDQVPGRAPKTPSNP